MKNVYPRLYIIWIEWDGHPFLIVLLQLAMRVH